MAEPGVLHFRGLRATLDQLAAGASPVDPTALRLQLENSKSGFRRVLEQAGANVKEKEELEKGWYIALIL